MREIIEQLPGVVYSYAVMPGGKGEFTFVSENASEILGISAGELKEDPDAFERVVIADDIDSFRESNQSGLPTNTFWSWEGRVNVRGQQRWVEIRSSEGESGIRHGLILDITSRKVRDHERALTVERTIRRNETLFTELFQSLPIGVVMLDDEGKVELVNKGFFEMFGYDLETLHGRNLNDFIVPEDLKSEGIDLNNLITANKVIMVETSRRHVDGHLIDVILYGVPVIFENHTIGIYGVYVNIDDRKRVEGELKIRNAELDNFVYKVSHDLRAPLSSILGLVNLARLPGNQDDPMDYINLIGQKVAHLDHFIGDVLSHSKNLKMEVCTTCVDFHAIISRTFTDLGYLDGASDVMVYRRIEGEPFHSDPWRIQEIFRNLASNAIKYARKDGIKPEIKIEIEADSRFAEIIFADNGIGIDEESLDKIFDMFYRATEQSNGSGIGLYIVKNAVEKLGGAIHVESKPGFGTMFNIKLPNSKHADVGNAFRFAVEKS